MLISLFLLILFHHHQPRRHYLPCLGAIHRTLYRVNNLILRTTNLHHRVSFPQRCRAIPQRVKINRNAERCTQIVVSCISLANRRARRINVVRDAGDGRELGVGRHRVDEHFCWREGDGKVQDLQGVRRCSWKKRRGTCGSRGFVWAEPVDLIRVITAIWKANLDEDVVVFGYSCVV
ncbi:hypothetical protein VTI74DRAFT_1312 [Chaetomium olivicolor]